MGEVMEEFIAFRRVDSEGDIWAEAAFLFRKEEDVLSFFQDNNPELIKIFAQESPTKIKNLKLHNMPGGILNAVTFYTKYAGEVKIVRMLTGYVISNGKNDG
ncbi:MAG: hypothetical protein ACK4SF_04435 [Algoriphagus aquaeductus]|uniref:hypothetical protein n=1 Tax=Algoriphagus aquaeductus TaxID=475299 RepID=UPI00391AEB82